MSTQQRQGREFDPRSDHRDVTIFLNIFYFSFLFGCLICCLFFLCFVGEPLDNRSAGGLCNTNATVAE
jgi:hypothetical protein